MVLFEDDCQPGVTLTVELGLITPGTSVGIWDVSLWDSGLWGGGAIRTDVSAYVRAFKTERAFSEDLKNWNAGKFTVVLDNLDGRFSPDNLAPGAPYVSAGLSGIRPGCPVWITMEYAGTSYPVFTGYVTTWQEGWALHYGPTEGDAYMSAIGYDEWGRLGRNKTRPAVGPVGAGDTYGQRIARILASAGFTGTSTIETGETTFQETDLSGEIVTELNKVVESEGTGAAVWAEADGSIVATGRYSLIESPRSRIVQVPFGDSVGEIPWADVDVAPVTDESIINHAVYARTGGTVQEYTDAVSISLYGVIDDPNSPTDLLCETDGQVAGLAQWVVLLNKDPESVVTSISLKPRDDLVTLAPLVLGSMIRDLISVSLYPPSATGHRFYRQCFIAGIVFEVSENDWTATFPLSKATAYRRFAESLWDEGLWGSSDVDPDGALWFV